MADKRCSERCIVFKSEIGKADPGQSFVHSECGRFANTFTGEHNEISERSHTWPTAVNAGLKLTEED